MGNLSASHFLIIHLSINYSLLLGFFNNHSILGGTIVLRTIIIAADFGTLYFGKLLEKLGLEENAYFGFIKSFGNYRTNW
jgi:hypothetical protein